MVNKVVFVELMNISNLKFSVVSGLVVTLITTIQAIVIAPILISSVGSDVYGAWVVVADVLVALQIFDFGITAYSAQKIATAKAQNDYVKCSGHVFATITLIFGLVIFLNFLCALVFVNYKFSDGLSHESQRVLRDCIFIGVAAVSLQLLSYSFIAPSRALERLSTVNVWAVLGALAGFFLTVALLGAGVGLYAAAIGLFARSFFNFIGGILSIYSLRSVVGARNLQPNVYWIALIDQVKNAPSTFLGNLSLLAISASENLLVSRFAGLSAVTTYSLSKKVFDLCRAVIDIFSYSSYGGISAGLASLQEPLRFRYLHRYTVLVVIFSAALVAPAYAFSEVFIKVWVGGVNYAGVITSVLIAAAAFLSCVSGFLFSALRAQGRFKTATFGVTVELISKVSMATLLIPWIGLSGMPVASMFGSVLTVVFAVYLTSARDLGAELRAHREGLYLALVNVGFACLSFYCFDSFFIYVFRFVCVVTSILMLRYLYLRLG